MLCRSTLQEAESETMSRVSLLAALAMILAPSLARAQGASPVHKWEISFEGVAFVAQVAQLSTQDRYPAHVVSIAATRSGGTAVATQFPIAGEPAGLSFADLDRDGHLEVVLSSEDYGSGRYGRVYVVECDGQAFDKFELPPLSPSLAAGYQGHDKFHFNDGQLVRSFERYRAEDPNCCPTGGTVSVRYRLIERGLEEVAH